MLRTDTLDLGDDVYVTQGGVCRIAGCVTPELQGRCGV